MDQDWQLFVLEHGWRAKRRDLALVLGQTLAEIDTVFNTGAVKKLSKSLHFGELFSLWHGRQPKDVEWPVPNKGPKRGAYEWQMPEIQLLISMVGTLEAKEIAKVLTTRLVKLTGDEAANRTNTAVQIIINRMGLQSRDVVGGISTYAAAQEVGSMSLIRTAILRKQLTTRKVGRLIVITHRSWAEWKSKRSGPPDGFVLLSSIKSDLAIASDKLPEFAKLGYVPTAILCTPVGVKGPSTGFGVWYIDAKVAKQMVADRRAGRPMPWHGKPLLGNLKITFKLWESRKHPSSCETCNEIWGKAGAPTDFEDYLNRYPPLQHGAKRHLTRKWEPGLTVAELAEKSGKTEAFVLDAIANGMIASTIEHGQQYISKTESTHWLSRKCPNGKSNESWLALKSAEKAYMFTEKELKNFIKNGDLITKVGDFGAMRGITYVSKHQCAKLRERLGFTEAEAAKRVGVTIPKLKALLDGATWRNTNGIPLSAVQTAIKRLTSREGYTLDEAAAILGTPLQWVIDRKMDGTVKVLKCKWDGRRVYINEPGMNVLRNALINPINKEKLGDEWLNLAESTTEAGVTAVTLKKWVNNDEIKRKQTPSGWRYHRQAIRARARTYWQTVHYTRKDLPSWLDNEITSIHQDYLAATSVISNQSMLTNREAIS